MPNIPAEFLGADPALASDKQVAFIRSLLDERDLFASPKWFDAVNAMDQGEYEEYLARVKRDQVAHLTKQQASEWITRLLELPKKAAPRADGPARIDAYPGVPAGRYALEDPADELNPVKFYHVEQGRDYTARGGKDWSAFLFVTRFSSDDRYPVKGKDAHRVLNEIAADPKGAAIRFGREENACAICGKRLTRRLSRELGIGPVCGARFHAETGEWAAVRNAARDHLLSQGLDPDEVIS
jgi:Family of unknown function (DUF6011)